MADIEKNEIETEEDTVIADTPDEGTLEALQALLDGNRVRFDEWIDDQLHARAIDAVNSYRDELAQVIFADAEEEATEEEPTEE